MEDFKTIAFFTFPSEYVVLKLLFDQEGIDYVFMHETMIGILPFHSNADGGIRLQVHKNHIEKAKKIISNLQDNTDLRIV